MSTIIDLVEYQSTVCTLSDTDRSWLASFGSRRFEITRLPGEDQWEIYPGPTVGIVELPSGILVRCTTKVPVENIFYMLATAYRFESPFLDQPIAFEEIDELFEFLVEHLVNLIDEQMRRGLYRAYIEREDNLPAVRGRIVIAEDLRQNAILRHRTLCQFTEFTWDIPENRVIRQTVFTMSQLVRKPELHQRLVMLDRALSEIDPTPLPLSQFDRFDYHRMNEDYRPIHQLCRLLLEGASVSEDLGEIGFRAFLLDMNQLYEQFLTEALRDELGRPLTFGGQWWSHLDQNRTVVIRPDIVVFRDGFPVAIADAKYKKRRGPEETHTDLYQVLAYCTAEDVHRGLLIYPKWEQAGEATVRIRNSEIEITHFAIDLAGSIDHVRHEVRRLADYLHQYAMTESIVVAPPAA